MAVLDKSARKNESLGIEKVPICTSEIRFLFRMWNRFRSTNKVFFYVNQETVCPPWDVSDIMIMSGWAGYAMERVCKYRNRIEKKLWEAFEKMASISGIFVSDSETIDAFHNIPWNQVNA